MAKGLCGPCYGKEKSRRRREKLKEEGLTAHTKDHCLCGAIKDARSDTCYQCLRKNRQQESEDKRPACHPERKWYASNKCRKCYMAEDGRSRRYQLRHWYKIELEQYQELLDNQNGRCAICQTETPGGTGTFHVDHDHSCCPGIFSCGRCIRGLLCAACNLLLGNARDNPLTLRAAVVYLEDHLRLNST